MKLHSRTFVCSELDKGTIDAVMLSIKRKVTSNATHFEVLSKVSAFLMRPDNVPVMLLVTRPASPGYTPYFLSKSLK